MIANFTRTIACGCLLAVSANGFAAEAAPNAGSLKAFPGAEGWGAASRGGRGGRAIKVTNLNASGPGSLAEACAADGPRFVVFDVSGVIRGNIRITKPYITIAGQTAPGAGITVEGVISSYNYGVHDIIIRQLRVRRRRDIGAGGDCIQLGGLGPANSGTYNIILDHLSLSWGNDEVIDLYHAHDATVQWCTVEESDDHGHSKGAHNYGLISAAEDNGAVSVHHNLWAHHARRVPCMAPYRENAAGDFCNNVIYNCRGGYVDDGHGIRAKSPVNLHKNYYRRGPQSEGRLYPYALSPNMTYYVRDNYFEDWGYQGHPRHWKPASQPGGVPRWIQFNNNGDEIDAPAKTPDIELVDAKAAYELVLAKAGCWPRDRVTKRILHEVTAKTGAWGRNAPLEPTDEWFLEGLTPSEPPTDTDGDGMPDAWEKLHGLDSNDPDDAAMVVPPGKSGNDRHRGYSYIEFYINELAENFVPPPRAVAPFDAGAAGPRRFIQSSGYKTETERLGGGNTHRRTAPTEYVYDPALSYAAPGYPVTDDSPATQVTWNDAVALCEWLGREEHAKYRLPTEAEWEYACRAGTATEYSFGDDLAQLGEYAWYGKNNNGRSGEVGTKRSNPFGLLDMHGNTREWCADWYRKMWYKRSPTEDPLGPETGAGRVLRGGKWFNKEPFLRSAYRFDFWPSYRSQYFGFRVVCERCTDWLSVSKASVSERIDCIRRQKV